MPSPLTGWQGAAVGPQLLTWARKALEESTDRYLWAGSHALTRLLERILPSKGALNTRAELASLRIVCIEDLGGGRRVLNELNTNQLLATFLQVESSQTLSGRAKARR